MELNLPNNLSPELRQLLEEHRAIVAATLKPCVEIQFVPQRDLTLWQSKIGGSPYLPKTVDYPKGENGTELQFLAQINFAEVPHLPDFPEAGMLQFYMAADDDLYGANFEDYSKSENFRVLYFPEIEADETQLVTDFSFLPDNDDYSPLSGAAALQFTKKFEPMSWGDYQFNDRLGHLFETDELRWEYAEKVGRSEGHRIGGYPGFTQTDPREYDEAYRTFDCLLFQLDSEEVGTQKDCRVDLMWGDTGIANFFIKSDALKRRDFSEILFNWDCC